MQIKEVVTRYENLLILSSDTTEVTSHYEIIFKCTEYYENIIGFNFFTTSIDIVPFNQKISKDDIENLRNSSYLKIGFIRVENVCVLAEFNHNGGIFRSWKFLL